MKIVCFSNMLIILSCCHLIGRLIQSFGIGWMRGTMGLGILAGLLWKSEAMIASDRLSAISLCQIKNNVKKDSLLVEDDLSSYTYFSFYH